MTSQVGLTRSDPKAEKEPVSGKRDEKESTKASASRSKKQTSIEWPSCCLVSAVGAWAQARSKTAAPGNMKAEKVKGEQLCLRGRETEKRREQTMKKEGEKGDVGSSDPALCAIVVSTRGQNLVFGVGQCFESPRQKKTFGFLCQGGISELTKEKEKEKEKGEEERERKRSGQERKRRGRGEQHKTSRKKKQATK